VRHQSLKFEDFTKPIMKIKQADFVIYFSFYLISFLKKKGMQRTERFIEQI
jgi:hypothetical protein